MKERTKAYVAGLMDSDGCFGIYRSVTEERPTSNFQPRIVIASVNLQLVKWLVANFGGFYTTCRPDKGRTWYQWNRNGSTGAIKFLSDILPYLRVKKREAQTLKEFYELGSAQNLEKRQELMDRMKEEKERDCLTTDTLDGHVRDKQTHAYLAGIFDGEGCISSTILPNGKSRIRIRMGVTHKPLIDLYQRIYGGWFHTQAAKGNQQEFYTWEITKRDLKETMLLQCLPYLRVKREQAKLALLFVRLPYRGAREDRHFICNQISELNSPKIQSDLIGNYECAPERTLTD
jgi:hypothetical protein